jgi:hypothetical protein
MRMHHYRGASGTTCVRGLNSRSELRFSVSTSR